MKVCFKCGNNKSLDSFYKHKQMKDGHLNKCKDCAKSEMQKNWLEKIKNPEFLKKERERAREKYHRLNYKEKKYSYETRKKTLKKYKKKFPEKIKAYCRTKYMERKSPDNNLHHWSYNKEHYRDVIELSISEHNKAHRFLKYDKKSFMYKDLNGVLLETKEKHLEYINKVIKNF